MDFGLFFLWTPHNSVRYDVSEKAVACSHIIWESLPTSPNSGIYQLITHYWGHKIKEVKTAVHCNSHGENEVCIHKFSWASWWEEDIHVEGKTILKSFAKGMSRKVRIVFVKFITGTRKGEGVQNLVTSWPTIGFSRRTPGLLGTECNSGGVIVQETLHQNPRHPF